MIQAIGYLRFSYPGRSDARLTLEQNADTLRERLYNPDRMKQRFHFFENICLPALDAQTDQNFKLLVLIGDDLPPDEKARLDALIVGRPYIELIADGSGDLNAAFNNRAEEMKDRSAKRIVHFRLDDDDALARHFIRDLKNMAKQCVTSSILTMSRGMMLAELDGEVHFIEEVKPYIAIGWTLALTPDIIRNPYQASHFRAATALPSMVDPRKYSYIHTIHAGSDSEQGADKAVRENLKKYGRDKEDRAYVKMINTLGREFPAFSVDYLTDIRLSVPDGPVYDMRNIKRTLSPRRAATIARELAKRNAKA